MIVETNSTISSNSIYDFEEIKYILSNKTKSHVLFYCNLHDINLIKDMFMEDIQELVYKHHILISIYNVNDFPGLNIKGVLITGDVTYDERYALRFNYGYNYN